MTTEQKAEEFINKHKRLQAEKERLEVKLELKRESLKKERLKLKELGYKNIEEARKALKEQEEKILEKIGDV